jgi:DNA polymerase/3'-5' exonuclease PolX
MSNAILDFPLKIAQEIARKYLEVFWPYMSRIEVAGSTRRCADAVHDLEFVAVPIMQTSNDLFGNPIKTSSLLDDDINRLASALGAVLKQNGPKKKKLGLMEGLDLELYLVTPPAQWGVIMAIRTGPWRYSNQLVTSKKYMTKEGRPGLMPSWLKSEDGCLTHRDTGVQYQTPEEADFFRMLEIPYVPPQERK